MIIRTLSLVVLACSAEAAQKRPSSDGAMFFLSDVPEYETVLTPDDFINAAHLHRRGAAADDDIWDSDAMYGKDRFEGDIANENLTATTVELFLNGGRTGEGFQSNAIRNRHQLWPNGRIPYALSSQYSSYSRSLIAASMQEYNTHTCIQWVPKGAQDVNYVYIHPDRGCYSMVGKMGGRQMLSLGSGCIQKGIIIHELMHAVGFFHEQSRTDRDDFITILWSNIQPGMQGQFEKYGQGTIQSLGAEYDYNSIMHYGNKAFSRNGQPTIIPKSQMAAIGQRSGFSKTDAFKINKLYGCSAGGSTTAPEVVTPPTPGGPITPAVITTTQPPPPPPTAENCKDHRGDCATLTIQGWCQRNPPWMLLYCPVSCGMCPSKPTQPTLPPPPTVPTVPPNECDDLRVDCETLVQQRYCRLAQNFMKTYCARSCGFCYKPPPTEIPDTGVDRKPVQVTMRPAPIIVQPTTNPLVTLWRTTTSPTPRPTESVQSTTSLPPTPHPCRDRKHFCAHWKGAGFCEGIFQNYMKKNCPASCGLC